jgi:hypothetical protein
MVQMISARIVPSGALDGTRYGARRARYPVYGIHCFYRRKVLHRGFAAFQDDKSQ